MDFVAEYGDDPAFWPAMALLSRSNDHSVTCDDLAHNMARRRAHERGFHAVLLGRAMVEDGLLSMFDDRRGMVSYGLTAAGREWMKRHRKNWRPFL